MAVSVSGEVVCVCVCAVVHALHPAKEKRKYFALTRKGWGFLCFFLYLSRKSWQSSHINEQHHQSQPWQWAEKRGICQTDDILLFSARAWLFIALFWGVWQKAYCFGMELQRGLCNKSARNMLCCFRVFSTHLFFWNFLKLDIKCMQAFSSASKLFCLF